MVDFEPDSVINLKLRKSDMMNFVLNSEGNLYNNLINKVIYRKPHLFIGTQRFVQVDEVLMNDCAVDGDYCKFNKRFLALLSKLESQDWFSKFEIPGEFEFTLDENGEYMKLPKRAQFYEVKFMSDIVYQKLKEIARKQTESSTTVPSLLLDELESFNFTEIYLEEGEESDGERRKRETNDFFRHRRKKREIDEDGSFFGEEEIEPVSYTDILNIAKRFITAIDKMIKSALSKKKKREVLIWPKEERCEDLDSFLYSFIDFKDGSQFSLAKITKSINDQDIIELEANADSSFAHCNINSYYQKLLSNSQKYLKEFRKFVEYKEFDDGFSNRIR